MKILADDWRHAWKYLSVHMAVLLAMIDTAGQYLPQIQAYVPEHYARYLALAIIIARVLNQGIRSSQIPYDN